MATDPKGRTLSRFDFFHFHAVFSNFFPMIGCPPPLDWHPSLGNSGSAIACGTEDGSR